VPLYCFVEKVEEIENGKTRQVISSRQQLLLLHEQLQQLLKIIIKN